MSRDPIIAAIDMGYGHLRAAQALADAFSSEVVLVDRPPVAGPDEEALWRRLRGAYEGTSRGIAFPIVGPALRAVLASLTAIARLHPKRDLSKPTGHVRALERLVASGLGDGLSDWVRESGRPLLTTYFTPALSADRHGCENVYCVVTDSDLSRAWVPAESSRTRIHYLAPSRRACRRLLAYGVPRQQVHHTGFPLPPELLGDDLQVHAQNLAARLVRLDPEGFFREPRVHELERMLGPLPPSQESEPPLVTFAIGGAGAQSELVDQLLPGMRSALDDGRFELALVAGTHADVAERFQGAVERCGLADHLAAGRLRIVHEPSFLEYYRAFNRLLARTDVLWTKPSELTFYGALGLPLVFTRPVGVHERYNRRWARERGVGHVGHDLRLAAHWLTEWLEDGVLAASAWSGFMLLPVEGTYRIVEAVTGAASTVSSTGSSETTSQERPA